MQRHGPHRPFEMTSEPSWDEKAKSSLSMHRRAASRFGTSSTASYNAFLIRTVETPIFHPDSNLRREWVGLPRSGNNGSQPDHFRLHRAGEIECAEHVRG